MKFDINHLAETYTVASRVLVVVVTMLAVSCWTGLGWMQLRWTGAENGFRQTEVQRGFTLCRNSNSGKQITENREKWSVIKK